MLVSKFMDGKSTPEGRRLAITGGIPIKKCRGMTYWLRWGEHTFDIRIMWAMFGIKEEQYFLEANLSDDHYVVNPNFYSGFLDAIKGKDFSTLISEHDKILDQSMGIF